VERFVSQNPDPVLRINGDERVIYSNKAGELFLHEWNIRVGEKVPISIGNLSKRVISRKYPEKIQIKVGKRIYLASFYPLEEDKQVEVYGFDITDYNKLKEKLQIKEKQYDALNQMGRIALRRESLQAFMDESANLTAKSLDIEYSNILEYLPDGNFLLRAGTGWKPGLVGEAIINGSNKYQAGYTLFSKIPVIVRDFKKEERFEAPTLLKEHDIASGVSVVIGKIEKPFGVLSVHSKKPRRFTTDDTYFLSSVAFLISEVIERRRAEEELRQYKERLEELVKERTSELVRTNERLIEEISGRKRVEKDLQNNVYFLETFLDAIPSPVFYRNLEGIYQGCNEMFAHILGFPKERVIGHSMFEFRDQFSKAIEISTFYDRLLLEEGKSISHELKVRSAIDGNERDFLVHRATYSNISGEIIGIVGVMLDITERKKAEQALTDYAAELERSNKRKEELEMVINSSPVIVFLWKYEEGWPIEFVSENVTRLGYEVKDFTSKGLLYRDIVYLEDLEKVADELNMYVEAGYSDYTSEYRIFTKSGEIRWVDERTVIQRDENGEIHLQGIILDITEHKKAENALLQMEEIRKKEIHHRIKNNLQVISSLLSLQAEHFSDKKVRESFQDSQNRVISMSLIHEELYKTGEIGNFETFDFKAYLQKLANELFRSYLVGNQDIHLKLDIESIFLGMDTGIPLGIIINELVSNSLKHAFPAGRKGEIQIKLHKIEDKKIMGEDRDTGRRESSEFLLVVSDNGVGIPDNIDFRHTSSLGFQLVSILVDQIEGSIELVRGAGTEFRIKFREDIY